MSSKGIPDVLLSNLPYLQRQSGVVIVLELGMTLPLFDQLSVLWQDIFRVQERKIDKMQKGAAVRRIDLQADWNQNTIRTVQKYEIFLLTRSFSQSLRHRCRSFASQIHGRQPLLQPHIFRLD